jgi:hypothetical protein
MNFLSAHQSSSPITPATQSVSPMSPLRRAALVLTYRGVEPIRFAGFF